MSEYSRLITEKIRKARKNHYCDACEILFQDIKNGSEVDKEFTPEEKSAYLKAKDNKGMILKGELYINQTCEFDSIIYNLRLKLDIWSIINKYKISYPE